MINGYSKLWALLQIHCSNSLISFLLSFFFKNGSRFIASRILVGNELKNPIAENENARSSNADFCLHTLSWPVLLVLVVILTNKLSKYDEQWPFHALNSSDTVAMRNAWDTMTLDPHERMTSIRMMKWEFLLHLQFITFSFLFSFDFWHEQRGVVSWSQLPCWPSSECALLDRWFHD